MRRHRALELGHLGGEARLVDIDLGQPRPVAAVGRLGLVVLGRVAGGLRLLGRPDRAVELALELLLLLAQSREPDLLVLDHREDLGDRLLQPAEVLGQLVPVDRVRGADPVDRARELAVGGALRTSSLRRRKKKLMNLWIAASSRPIRVASSVVVPARRSAPGFQVSRAAINSVRRCRGRRPRSPIRSSASRTGRAPPRRSS